MSAALRLVDVDDTAARMGVHTARHAALFSLGRLEDADDEYGRIERLGGSAAERPGAAALKVWGLTYRVRMAEAIEFGVASLREFGIAVPPVDVVQAELDDRFGLLYRWLDDTDPADDVAHPEIADPALIGAIRLMDATMGAAYLGDDARAAGVVEPGVGRDLARARPEPRRPRLGFHRGLLRGGLARRRRRRVPGAAAAHGAGRGARLGTRQLAGALHLRPRRVASRPARDRGASRSARLRGSRRGGRAGRRLLRLPAGGGRPPGLRPVAGGLCRRGGRCGVVRPAHRQRAGRPELRELPLARGRAEGRDAGRGPDPPGRPLRRQPAGALRRACDARDRRRGAWSSGRAEPPQRGGDEAAVGRDGALPHGVGLPAARARARRAGARRPDRRARRRPGRARRDDAVAGRPRRTTRQRTSCTCSGCWRPSGRGRSATSAAPPSPSTARSARPRSEPGRGTGR